MRIPAAGWSIYARQKRMDGNGERLLTTEPAFSTLLGQRREHVPDAHHPDEAGSIEHRHVTVS